MLKIYLFYLLVIVNLTKSQTLDSNEDLLKYKHLDSYVELRGGDFLMGINDKEGHNFEYPQRKGIVKAMRVMLYPVSIASFKKYKQVKHMHKTDAELAGHSWVFNQLLNKHVVINENLTNLNDTDTEDSLNNELISVLNTSWYRPEGGDSSIEGRLNHPVTHVSYHDAFGYCAWKGMRLPNEIEWEYAARGGLNEQSYPWGDYWELKRTNLWQGKFPNENQIRDGHYGISPVNAFQPQNNYEMYDVLGNVWEWTSTLFKNKTQQNLESTTRRCLKGGSFLDARDGDYRTNSMLKIRLSARIGRGEHYTAHNVGFRCIQQIKDQDLDFYLRNLGNEKFRVVRLRPPMHHRNSAVNNSEETPRKIEYKTEL